MRRIWEIGEMREASRRARAGGKAVGFVPTMGYLHEGHLALVRQARRRSDLVVVSIFVNPTQFDRKDDLQSYPRDVERDRVLLEGEGVDVLFTPTVESMYPADFSTAVEVGGLTAVLCGAHRPGHFRGVATVVAKLFNIVEPDVAFFGEKDFQQLVVIRRMVRDLNFGVEIVAVPTAREADGVAFSSRNARLRGKERVAARCLVRALGRVERAVCRGERQASELVRIAGEEIAAEPLARAEYISVCDPGTLEEVSVVEGPALVALAVWVGNTRLIDNRVVTPPGEGFEEIGLRAVPGAERSKVQ